MNASNAKDYLPLVQALAEGKTIEFLNSNAQWEDCEYPSFNQMPVRYRIKPEPKKGWYRVVLFKNGTTTAEDEDQEKRWSENNPNFVRWLTDRIEYTLPEGDA